MPIRHRKKQKKNISGLKNQPRHIPEPSSSEPLMVEPYFESNITEQVSADLEDNEDFGLKCHDSSKLLWRGDDNEELERTQEEEADLESGIEDEISRLEILIKDAGHRCIFLQKFHCKLNPIEMVCLFMYSILKFIGQ